MCLEKEDHEDQPAKIAKSREKEKYKSSHLQKNKSDSPPKGRKSYILWHKGDVSGSLIAVTFGASNFTFKWIIADNCLMHFVLNYDSYPNRRSRQWCLKCPESKDKYKEESYGPKQGKHFSN